eukprot:COSAG02_NODE_19739_length_866_cov_25.646675_1_plen_22_part_10
MHTVLSTPAWTVYDIDAYRAD